MPNRPLSSAALNMDVLDEEGIPVPATHAADRLTDLLQPSSSQITAHYGLQGSNNLNLGMHAWCA